MALQSMTGFARSDGVSVGQRWTWELRSVNGKGLDIRLRLPPGLERLENVVRERAGKRFSRGSCSFNLTITREHAAGGLRINDDVLTAVIEAMRHVAGRIDAAPPRLDGILALKGVLETSDPIEDEERRATLDAALLGGLELALSDLEKARAVEGRATADVLFAQLDEIERLTHAAEACPARRPEVIRDRLADQVRELLNGAPMLDPQRLYQEAIMIATRADIREELDRLTTHVAQGRQLLDTGGPVGRRLDFLAQEFNRETNTLCSKSNDKALTAIGLDLKAVVDQLREQIQNIE